MAHHRPVDDFAEILMSPGRLEWQNPDKIVRALGVKQGMKVADIGCGPGFFTIPLARAVGQRGAVYAVDANSRMLEHLHGNVEKSGFAHRVIEVHADAQDTKITRHTLDLVLFANLLHDIDDKPSFLNEARMIMKPSGSAVDVDWKKERSEFGPPLSIRLGEDEARHLLEQSGLTVVRTVDPGPYHYGLVCEKE